MGLRIHYPWSLWLNGDVWQLTQGVEFHCTPGALRSMAYRAADRRGGKLETALKGPQLTLVYRSPDDLFIAPCSLLKAEKAWQRMIKEHMLPSRLFEISVGLLEGTAAERQHIERCEMCQRMQALYRATPDLQGHNEQTPG